MSKEEKVVVVGAGQMGLGIAHAFALACPNVVMVDVSAAQLEKAVKTIHDILDGGVKLGKVEPATAEAAKGALTTSQDLAQAARKATLVVETATEKLDIKLDILRTVDDVVADDAILGTNTSALSITEMAAATKNPSRVVGIHFFNPVHKMKLVEIIRGLQTSEEVVKRVQDWSARINKDVITVNESPGFTTSRMSAMLGNEAMWMLQEGVATAEDIDKAMRMAFNHPMGPLELGDLTGWDTRLAVIQHLHATLGEKFRPCPLILKMVKAGRYGRKVGHGVYKYENGQKVPGSGLKVSI